MQFVKKSTNVILLLVILTVASALRFYNYSTMSYTHDELSAIERAEYSTFSELIEKGIRPDGHPAGIQVLFFFWIKLFGNSEISLRITFVVFGILSVFLSYLIAARWFNPTTGLLSASFICFLEHPLIYSQIARPYSAGLFFVLCAAFFWTKFFTEKKYNNSTIAAYGFFTALSLYTHYFSALTALIIAVSGFVFLNKLNAKKYLLALFIIALTFLPHLGITLDQLSLQGLGWLGAPNMGFVKKYLAYCFNNSGYIAALAVFPAAYLYTRKIINFGELLKNPFRYLSLAWFILPLIIGYCYSVWIAPVLQFSVLIFSFPFLFFFICSFADDFSAVYKSVIVFVFLSVGVYSTVFERNFYQTQHFGVFRELAQDIMKWDEKLGEKNISKIAMVSSPYMIKYYLHNKNEEFLFANVIESKSEILKLKKMVENAQTEYFLYTWSSSYNPIEILSIIQDNFPVLVERKFYFNSEFYFFSKNSNFKKLLENDTVFSSLCNYENIMKQWNTDGILINKEKFYSETNSEMLDNSREFSATFSAPVADLINSSSDIIETNVWAWMAEMDSNAELVMSIEKNGQSVYWRSSHFSDFSDTIATWNKIYLSERIPDFIYPHDKSYLLKIYVWNSQRKNLLIDNFSVSVRRGNPIIYGKRN